MAIKDTSQQQQEQSQGHARYEQQQQQQQASDTGRRPGGAWSFHQRGLLNNPTAGGSGGEYLASFKKGLEEAFKEIADGIEVKVISLNRHALKDLKFSAVLVALRDMRENPDLVAYYTFILEATGEKLKVDYRTIDGQNTPINWVTGDANDQYMKQNAYDTVKQLYKNCTVVQADADVIYAKDRPQNDATKMEEYAKNSACACIAILNINQGNFGDLDLTKMDRDDRFTIDMIFGNHQIREIDGSPVRANTILSFSSQRKVNSREQPLNAVNVPDATVRVSTLYGFLQPVWAPQENSYSSGWGAQAHQRPDSQNMVAEFVGTAIHSDYATSPSAVLLGFSTILSLVDNNHWLMGFLPRANRVNAESGRVNIDDLGALNVMANITNMTEYGGFGLEMDTKGFGDDLGKWQAYLIQLFRPGLMVSLDCPEVGPQSWVFAPFALAASGDPEAKRVIWDAGMELTGGYLADFYSYEKPMFTNIIRVPGGRYTVGNAEQDIRHIDLTAISNVNAKNPRIIQEYATTFADVPGVSPERALAMRENIIREAVGHQCEIDRYFARVTFDGEFLNAISQALNRVGLPLTVNTPMSQDLLRSGAPAPSFVNSSVASGTRTFRGHSYQGNQRPTGGYYGRYNRR